MASNSQTFLLFGTNALASDVLLSCRLHKCPQRCHQLFDHSKVKCAEVMKSECPAGHKMTRHCYQQSPKICPKCVTEARRQLAIKERDHRLQHEREKKRQEYESQIADLDAKIESERQAMRDQNLGNVRQRALEQKRKDLAEVMAKNKQTSSTQSNASKTRDEPTDGQHSTPQITPNPNSQMISPKTEGKLVSFTNTSPSTVQEEWEYQKEFQGAKSDVLDSLMGMIGLEEVKEKFLGVKAKVETAIRQNTSFDDERFGAVLLGNPGTGRLFTFTGGSKLIL